jgi:hypothetical protein
MSVINHDARAPIPQEYSASNPRHPNKINENSQTAYEQLITDTVYDNPQKQSLTCSSQKFSLSTIENFTSRNNNYRELIFINSQKNSFIATLIVASLPLAYYLYRKRR